jgi:hypothetical protein
MSTIQVKVIDQVLSAVVLPEIACNSQNVVRLGVQFDTSWNGYTKTAVFYTDKNKSPFEKVLSTDGFCIIPPEVLTRTGYLYIGIKGVNDSNVKTTTILRYKVVAGTPVTVISEPTDNVYHQLLQYYTEIKGRVDNLIENTGATEEDEVVDGRVGYDGTVYGNLHEAITEQVKDVRADFSVVNEVAENTMGLKWNNGYYLNVNGTVQVDAARTLTDFILCGGGLEFAYMAETNHASIAAVTFYDSNKRIISKISNIGEMDIEYKAVAPEKCAFVRLSARIARGHYIRINGATVPLELSKRLRASDYDVYLSCALANASKENLIYKAQKGNNSNATISAESALVNAGGYYFPNLNIKSLSLKENSAVNILEECEDELFDGNVAAYISSSATTRGTNFRTFERKGKFLLCEIESSKFTAETPYLIISFDGREYEKAVSIDRIVVSEGAYLHTEREKVYVDGENGSDENSGTINAPFKTIQKGIDSGASTILVAFGEYEEAVKIEGRQNIKIMPYGFPSYDTQNPDNPMIRITGGEDKAIAYPLTITDCANVYIENVWCINGSARGAYAEDCANLEMNGCQFSNCNSGGLGLVNVNGIFRDCKAFDIGNGSVEHADGFNIHGYGNTQFINCVAHDCGDDGISHHDACTGLIDGGEFYNCGKGGVASPTHGAKIDVQNVYSHDNAYGLYAHSDIAQACKGRLTNCLFKNNKKYDISLKNAVITGWSNIFITKEVDENSTFVG